MIKYAVYPGEVKSKSDGDTHLITASQLMSLYRVNPKECVVIDFERPETYLGRDVSNLIKLYPREDGNYANDIK